MNVEKEFLLKLIKSGNGENSYLLNLYKIYDLCNKISNGKFKKQKHLLDDVEDKIYTVNGRVLSEQERIALEIKRVYKDCGNISDKNIRAVYIQTLKDIVGTIDFNFENEDIIGDYKEGVYLVAKQTLSIAQAKLDIPISFLYAASTVFVDIYESEYLNSHQFLSDIFNSEEKIISNNIYNDKKFLYSLDKRKDDGR